LPPEIMMRLEGGRPVLARRKTAEWSPSALMLEAGIQTIHHTSDDWWRRAVHG
jgi:hypothetical protein